MNKSVFFLKIRFLFLAILCFASSSSSENSLGSLKCSPVLNFVRLSSTNVLFVGDQNRNSLDRGVYLRALENFKDYDRQRILDFLRTNTQIRIVEAEEIIAALDSLVPLTRLSSNRSLFSILDGFNRLQIDEIELSENLFDDPGVQADELILRLTKKLHELSLSILGSGRILLSKPRIFEQEITRLDAFLEILVADLKPSEDLLAEVFRRPLITRPGIREAAFALGFAWSHPVEYYSPNLNRTPLAFNDPAKYSKQLFYQLAPSTVFHWLRTHLMWATFAGFLIMLPNQIMDMRLEVSNLIRFYNVIEHSKDGQKILSESYNKNLKAIYSQQIQDWEAELRDEKRKLLITPGNQEVQDKIKLLEEQISYFQANVSDPNSAHTVSVPKK